MPHRFIYPWLSAYSTSPTTTTAIPFGTQHLQILRLFLSAVTFTEGECVTNTDWINVHEGTDAKETPQTEVTISCFSLSFRSILLVATATGRLHLCEV